MCRKGMQVLTRRFYEYEKLILLLIIFIFVGGIKPAFSQQIAKESSFTFGENVSFEVFYNLGFLYVKAGNVNFQVDSLNFNNEKIYYFKNIGTSLPEYDWFFKVRDEYKSYAQINSLLPLEFYRENNEGDFHLKNKYIFDYDKNIITTETKNTNRAFSKDTIQITHDIFDVLSATYFVRNLDFTNCELNDSFPVSIIIDREIHNLYIRYLGTEIIEDRNETKYDCIKFSTLLLEGTIFNAGENIIVWVSNDKNKVPILIEAKIIVGAIKVFLSDYSGLKYPFLSINLVD